jgi:23S rRNA pseudouridine1911/1915/1917 synthase
MTEEEELTDQQELFEHFRFQADPGQSITRIDKFLSDRLMNASRTRIQTAANAGNILVNNMAVKPSYKIKPGDLVTVVLPTPPREVELIPEDIPLNIVYEDDDVLVVNKEPGMVVHPAHGNYTGTLVNALMWHFRDLPLFNSGESRPGLVHRLDKNTSGILVIAKNEFALNRLSKQFYDRTTDRRYNALVWGIPEPREGTITGNVGRSVKDRKVMQVFKDGSEGKTAVTHYKVLEDFGYISLIECKLETGRTHQIRVHMSHVRHPLFNDAEYGGDQIIKGTTFTKYQQFIKNCFKILPRQALHAKSLAFNHPVTGKRLSFDSPLPDDMVQVIEKWRKYVAGREEI